MELHRLIYILFLRWLILYISNSIHIISLPDTLHFEYFCHFRPNELYYLDLWNLSVNSFIMLAHCSSRPFWRALQTKHRLFQSKYLKIYYTYWAYWLPFWHNLNIMVSAVFWYFDVLIYIFQSKKYFSVSGSQKL